MKGTADWGREGELLAAAARPQRHEGFPGRVPEERVVLRIPGSEFARIGRVLEHLATPTEFTDRPSSCELQRRKAVW